MNIEIMRGFAATRRRGTETGGILIGRIDRLSEPVVYIEEFEVVPCEYALGPSYVLSANDQQRFKEAIARWEPSPDRELRAVGYFRSHTRDGFALDDQDAELFREYFRDPLDVALLVKPFATRSATAGFFLQNNGHLTTEVTPQEFPFVSPGKRRKEEAPAPETPQVPIETATPAVPPAPAAPMVSPPPRKEAPFEYHRPMFPEQYRQEPSGWIRRVSWMAFTMAVLAFGAVCGYEYGASRLQRPYTAGPTPSDFYSVGLQVTQSDAALLVKWNRDAAPIQAAMNGVLTVVEGENGKEVKLGFAELRNGIAMYPHVAPEVRFRLELFFKKDRSFVETVEFKVPTAQ